MILLSGVGVLGGRMLQVGATTRGPTATLAAPASQREESAAERRRKQEMLAGLDRFADFLGEARAFTNWVRRVRSQIKIGRANSLLQGVNCSTGGRRARRSVTCSGTYLPRGKSEPPRYQLLWYEADPSVMRATALNLPFSPVLNCEALGLRERHRRSEDGGLTTFLHCTIDGSTESYAIWQTQVSGTRATTLWWYSAGYLARDAAARRAISR